MQMTQFCAFNLFSVFWFRDSKLFPNVSKTEALERIEGFQMLTLLVLQLIVKLLSTSMN